MAKKYHLKKKIARLTEIERYALLLTLGKSLRTLERWCSIPKGSKCFIPEDSLMVLCETFKCTPEELVNN